MKCQPPWFSQVVSGTKTWELRLGDTPVEPGELLCFQEWDPESVTYTGREQFKLVHARWNFSWSQLLEFWSEEDIKRHGLSILSLRINS